MARPSASTPARTLDRSSGWPTRRSFTTASAFCASQAPCATGTAKTTRQAPPTPITERINQSDRIDSTRSPRTGLYSSAAGAGCQSPSRSRCTGTCAGGGRRRSAGHAAIDHQTLARDEAGVVAQQEAHDRTDILDATKPAKRGAVDDLAPLSLLW